MHSLPHPGLLALGVAAGVLMLWPLRVGAFNPQPDPPAFGPVGLDPFATIRLNAICADGPLPGGVQPGPCDVTLVFRDGNGRVLNQATKTLLPGQGAFLDLPGSAPPPDPDRTSVFGYRAEVHPFIAPIGKGFVLATAEVIDNLTGRTIAVLNPTEPKSLTPSTAGQ